MAEYTITHSQNNNAQTGLAPVANVRCLGDTKLIKNY